MHYDHINRDNRVEYASIAHGLPEYRVPSFGEIDGRIGWARAQQGHYFAAGMKAAFKWVASHLGLGRTSAAS